MRRLRLALGALAFACTPSAERLQALHAAATAAKEQGRLASALEQARAGGEQARARGGDDEWAWRFRLLEAEALQPMGRDAEAEQLARAPLPAGLAGGELGARREKILARAAMRRRPPALDEADERLRRAAAMLPADDPLPLALDVKLQQARLAALRRDGRADGLFEEIQQRAAAADLPYLEALALNGRAYELMHAHECDRAIPLYEGSAAAAHRAGAESVAATATANQGECHLQLGDLARARALLDQALATHQRLGSQRSMAAAVGELGMALAAAGDDRGALARWRQALELARGHRPDLVGEWACLAAERHLDRDELPQARALLEEAGRGVRLRPEPSCLEIASARLAHAGGDGATARRLLERAAEEARPRDAVRWLARSELGAIAAEAGDHAGAERWFQAAFAEVAAAQTTLSSDDHRITFLNGVVRLYHRYADLLMAAGRTAQALEVVESSRARVLQLRLGLGAEARPVAAADLQALARRRGEVLLSYWVGPRRSHVWAVTPAGIHVRSLPGEARLRALVEEHRRALERGLRDPRQADDPPGRRLYALLVAPLAAHLRAGARVVIAADGPLHALPFAALIPADGPARYWVEDVALALAPALGVLPDRPVDAARPALVVGAPRPADPAFAPLPFAAAEVETVAAALASPRRLVGAAATPRAFLGLELGRFGVIHFAAHAVASAASPLDGSILLSADASGDRLTVRDVLEARLDADLVTVSACRSAGAVAYAGEGLVGFAWGFLGAGARRVIAGLWDVPDASTADLMSALYQRLRAGDDAPEALRAAQRALATRRPWHWAAFQVWLGPGRAGRENSRRPL